jgi:hypothetical protein
MTLSIIARDITDENGTLLEGAVVTIRQGHTAGGALAALFSDAAGTVPVSNPVTATTGSLSVYVQQGRYRLEGTSAAGSGVVLVDASPFNRVVTSGTDVTAGRLLTTAAGPAQAYRRGNILGTVSQGAGVPTGAIIERGSNANGQFVRLADGTQECWHGLTVPFLNGSVCQVDWTFPAAFAASGGQAQSGVINAGASSVAPDLGDLSGPFWTNSGANTTTWRIQVRRRVGSEAFVAGNQVTVNVRAVGRWF